MPKPQSLAFTYCGVELVSIVLLQTGIWQKTCDQILLNSATSSGFGTKQVNQMSYFGDNPYACDAAYEGDDCFEISDRKGMILGVYIIKVRKRFDECKNEK